MNTPGSGLLGVFGTGISTGLKKLLLSVVKARNGPAQGENAPVVWTCEIS
jgi:hypothetical protein